MQLYSQKATGLTREKPSVLMMMIIVNENKRKMRRPLKSSSLCSRSQ